jgi:hypothetical protein
VKRATIRLSLTAATKQLGTSFIVALFIAGCAKQPPDDADLQRLEFDGLMGDRYTEILPVFGNVMTRDFIAGVYNTVGLNDPDGTGDTSPQAILDEMDLDKVKGNHGALSVVLNGPRLWTIDHLGVNAGKERAFQGLKARWVMWFPIPEEIRKGNSFVMKSASLIKDPSQKFENLIDLGSRLQLAAGWKFRTRILGEDLVFKTKDGKSFIVQDDIGNTYDRVGGSYSNYKP